MDTDLVQMGVELKAFKLFRLNKQEQELSSNTDSWGIVKLFSLKEKQLMPSLKWKFWHEASFISYCIVLYRDCFFPNFHSD